MHALRISILALAALPMGQAVSPARPPASPAPDDAPAYAPFFKPAAAAPKSPNSAGYIQRWLLLEPINIQVRSNAQLVDGFIQANVKKEYFPNQFTVVPKDGDKVTVDGKELAWHAVDALGYNVNLFHFAADIKKPAYNAVYWAVTVVNCPRELRDVRLSVGSNSGSIWWVNGKEVIDLYGDRHMKVNDGVSKRLTLNKGPNVIRVAVINSPGLSNMCARFVDANYEPVREFTITALPSAK
jgi:hypothetical protein